MAPDLLDTLSRARQAYASVSELRPEQARASENVTSVVDEDRQPADVGALEGFERSAERFWELAGWLAGGQARDLEHSQLEARWLRMVASCSARCYRITSICERSASRALMGWWAPMGYLAHTSSGRTSGSC